MAFTLNKPLLAAYSLCIVTGFSLSDKSDPAQSPPLIASLVMGLTGIQSACAADQQGQVDDGVSFGQSLLGNVQDLSKTSDSNQVPGYGGSTGLPQTDYYSGQDISTMQEDAIVDLTSGTANEAAQYGYDQASVPKLQFSPDDPIFLNANTVGNDAVLNPEVLTVPTGDCQVEDSSQAVTRIEHCTAWAEPTDHNCSNTLNVTVDWHDESNCPIGTAYNNVTVPYVYEANSYLHARAYCNPALQDQGKTIIQINALETQPTACGDWVDVPLDVNMPNETYVATVLGGRSDTSCRNHIPWIVTAMGGCVDGQCNYHLKYHRINGWSYDVWEGNGGATIACRGGVTPRDFTTLGQVLDPRPDWVGMATGRLYWEPVWFSDGVGGGNISFNPTYSRFCVRNVTTLDIAFEQPTLTRVPTVSEEWSNGCAHLEAQVQ